MWQKSCNNNVRSACNAITCLWFWEDLIQGGISGTWLWRQNLGLWLLYYKMQGRNRKPMIRKTRIGKFRIRKLFEKQHAEMKCKWGRQGWSEETMNGVLLEILLGFPWFFLHLSSSASLGMPKLCVCKWSAATPEFGAPVAISWRVPSMHRFTGFCKILLFIWTDEPQPSTMYRVC